jgi:hypothetical protein
LSAREAVAASLFHHLTRHDRGPWAFLQLREQHSLFPRIGRKLRRRASFSILRGTQLPNMIRVSCLPFSMRAVPTPGYDERACRATGDRGDNPTDPCL